MESPAACRASSASRRRGGASLRIAFLGAKVWLDGCAPPSVAGPMECAQFAIGGGGEDVGERLLAAARAFDPHVCVVFDPAGAGAENVTDLPGVTVGVLVGESDPAAAAEQARGRAGARAETAARAEALSQPDRLVSFTPARTGTSIAGKQVWRSLPAPVSDSFYQPVRSLDGPPRAMSIGRSTRYREHMLMPTKHHHDLLQVIHGVSGASLRELLSLHDVGVYVPPRAGGGYGHQVGLHLAAGQLLFSDALEPAHGLETDIDFLQFDSPEGLVWSLERLASFPEMHQRVRVRGRLKAEQYRASRVFARLTHDLLADVAAFG